MAGIKTKKPHWTQKLKDENKKLREGLYKVLDGHFETTLQYKLLRQSAIDFQKMVWAGESSMQKPKSNSGWMSLGPMRFNEGDKVKINGEWREITKVEKRGNGQFYVESKLCKRKSK